MNFLNKFFQQKLNKIATEKEVEASSKIHRQIEAILSKENTKVIFDPREDRISIVNFDAKISVIVNCETNMITMQFGENLDSATHNVVIVETIRDLCETHNHREFMKTFEKIMERRIDIISNNDANIEILPNLDINLSRA